MIRQHDKQNIKTWYIGITLFILIAIMFFVSLNAGYIKIPLEDVMKSIFGISEGRSNLVLFEFRLPRMVLALLIGAGIAVSGAILQSISQNPLADPGILGINAGAGFAVVLYMFFFQGTAFITGKLSIFALPFAALVGAFVAAMLIYILAWKNKGVTPTRLILVGIGVNAAFSAGLIVLQMKMNPNDFMDALVWLSGSIWGTNWTFVWSLLPWIIILIPLAIYKSRTLDILRLGDPIAIGLGAHVERDRRLLLLIAVGLAGACVAAGGGITFLGLIAPHLAKQLVGARHARIIPISALLGALLLLSADALGRVIIAPAELPVGLVVSILGAPYFIYLLIKTN
ncbi:FecCD family ABC transporter permease [Paenibacillus marinisediminis]